MAPLTKVVVLGTLIVVAIIRVVEWLWGQEAAIWVLALRAAVWLVLAIVARARRKPDDREC